MNVFIISWEKHHGKAISIAEKIAKNCKKLSVVYSDPDETINLRGAAKFIKRPNNLFWEDKFKTCLDETGDEGILIIHADCECDNWERLVDECDKSTKLFANIGVWAPQINGTYFDLINSGIAKIPNSKLVLSALTDGIIFYLSPEVVKRMKTAEYGENIFGWGIDLLACSYAHIQNLLVVIDTSIIINHPFSKRGYDSSHAKHLEQKFLKQFSWRERIQCELLTSYVHYRHAKNSSATVNSFS